MHIRIENGYFKPKLIHSRKETGPMHFLRVKPVLMLKLINWPDSLLDNNNNNNNTTNNNNNNYYYYYYYFNSNSNDNINGKEYLGEVFRSVNKLALRTCSAVPCILNSTTPLPVYEIFKACCYNYFLLRVPQFFCFSLLAKYKVLFYELFDFVLVHLTVERSQLFNKT